MFLEQLERRELLAFTSPSQISPDEALLGYCPDCDPQLVQEVGIVSAQTGELAVPQPATPLAESAPFLPAYSMRELRGPIATVELAAPASSPPDQLRVRTTFNGNTTAGTFYDTSLLPALANFQLGEQLDATGLGPGHYPFSMDFTEFNSGTPGSSSGFNGHVLVAGPSPVSISPGWTIPAIESLTVDADGAVWQTGSDIFWFAESGGTFSRPDGDQQYSTLIDNLDGTYTLSNRFGEERDFNSLGLIAQIRDRLGNATTFNYSSGDITSVVAYDGRTLTYAYDVNGRIDTITDFDGRVVTLAYDGNDRLESLTYPDPDSAGPLDPLVVEYAYDGSTDFLQTVTEDALGAADVTEFVFDFSGGVTTRINQDASTEGFTAAAVQPLVDPLSGFGTALNPADVVLSSSIAATQTNVAGHTTTLVLGPFGLAKKIVDPYGQETVFTRDVDGRILTQTDPDPDDGGGQTAAVTTYDYDLYGNLESLTLADSTVFSWEYDLAWHQPEKYVDALGLVTLYEFDADGNVELIRQVIGNVDDLINLEEDDLVTQFEYTPLPTYSTDPPAGLVSKMTDAEGRITLYEHNARGDVTKITYADGTADEAEVEFNYGGPFGLPDYELDELGRRTDFTYDDLGRLILLELPDPDGGGNPLPRPEYEFEYDAFSRTTKAIDALDRETVYTYDSRGRLTHTKRPDHDSDSNLTIDENIYDDGNLLTSIDPLDRETHYTHDKLRRLTKTTLPEVPDWTTAQNEVQIIDFDSGTEGTFKLNGNSKTGLVDLADTSDFQTVLDSLWGAGNTNVKVTATEATVTFKGDLSATDVAQMTITDITGTKGATPAVTTDTAGTAPDMVNPTLETVYDNIGRVTKTIDAMENETTFAYANFGREVTITYPDPDGAGTDYQSPVVVRKYDPAGNLVEETDANGGTTTWQYDVLGRLIKLIEADPDDGGPLSAPVTEYEYDHANNLRFVTDPLGNRTEYQYDHRDRLTKIISEDPDGAGALPSLVTEYLYDDASQVIKVTAPGSRETSYDVDGLGRVTKITQPDPDGKGSLDAPEIEFTYDAAGRKLTMTDPLDNVTAYGYDLLDHLVEVTQADPDGMGSLTAPVSKWEYDAAGQLVTATDPLDSVTTYVTDNWGRTTQSTHADPDGMGSQESPVNHYRFDFNGNLLQVRDPVQLETNFEYDPLNRRTVNRDALGGETLFDYDANNNLVSLTDPVNNTTTWEYDLLNRTTQETNELGKHRYFAYDAAGNLVRKTDRNARDIVYEYDNLHRQVAEEWWTGTYPSIDVTTTTEASKTSQVRLFGFYAMSAGFSGTFTLSFDGQTTSPIAWNASDATVQTALEDLSNIGVGDVIVEKLDDSPDWQEWRVTFTGSLIGPSPWASIDTSGLSHSSSYIYDIYLGVPGTNVGEVQVVTLNDTTGGTFRLGFGGELTAAIAWNASTSTVDAALEALSGAGTISVSGSAGGPYTITFTGAYAGLDIAPLDTRTNDLRNANLQRELEIHYSHLGEVTYLYDYNVFEYGLYYDNLGRMTSYFGTTTGSVDFQFDSEYNAAGSRTVLQSMLGGTNDFKNVYSYDNLQRLTTVVQQSASSGNVVAPKRIEFNYNDLGQFTSINRYAAASATEFVAASYYSYDDLHRLTQLVHSESTTAPTSGWGADPLAGYEFDYDAASRILAIDSYLDGLSEYEHDDTYQLLAADHATMTDEDYEYDANGNRTMAGYTIGDNNQLTSDGTYTYTYDDEGNRLTRTRISDDYVTRYEWDFRNRLTKITEEDDSSNVLQVTINSYDIFNQWIGRSFDADGPGGTAATNTYFVYESGQIVWQFDGAYASDLTHRYLWGPQTDQFIAAEQVTSLGSAGDVLWGLGDHLNTQRDLVTYDASTDDATIANHREYGSFGVLTGESNAAVDLLFGFTGRPFDEDNKVGNHLWRWYDVYTAAWLSQDPKGFAAIDTNLTRYVGNLPTSITDPSGLEGVLWNVADAAYGWYEVQMPKFWINTVREYLRQEALERQRQPNSTRILQSGKLDDFAYADGFRQNQLSTGEQAKAEITFITERYVDFAASGPGFVQSSTVCAVTGHAARSRTVGALDDGLGSAGKALSKPADNLAVGPRPQIKKPPPSAKPSPATVRAPAADNWRGRYMADRRARNLPLLPDDWDVHHRIPREYMDHPGFSNFDFHHPSNLRGVRGSRSAENVHQRITNEWAAFGQRNPNATRPEIEAFASYIDSRYASEWFQ